jgi:L-lactate utilization protein LutC
MKTSSAKAKGRELQKWVCQQISKITGLDWGYEDEKLIQPRIMGQKGKDVVLRGEALKFKFDVECKRTEKFNLYEAIEQAKSNTEEGRFWMVVHKKNRYEPIVVLDAKDFFEMYGGNI